MNTPKFDAVIFDLDSTLVTIEGIVALASEVGCEEEITRITQEAMDNTGMNVDIYEHRLNLIRPSLSQLKSLGELYYQMRTDGVDEVVRYLNEKNIAIYIVSAGMRQAIEPFAKKMTINPDNIFAVDILFDEQGNYADFDRESSLANTGGKREVAKSIKAKHESVLYVGDGKDDADTKDIVDLFIGFGGVAVRDYVKDCSDVYIQEPSLLPLLDYFQ